MMKKTLTIVSALVLLAALAACSTIQSVIGGSKAQTNPGANGGAAANGRGGFGGDPATMTVEQKMGFAILKMDGSPTALTAQQAKDMLPLWQALKSMETSNTASADEITAIFTQMKDTLTAEQVSAVQKMTWTQADMTALMQQYGVQMGGGQGGFGGNGTLSPEQQATRTARFAAGGNNRQGGGFPQGGPGGAGAPGGAGGPGGFPQDGGPGGFGGNGASTPGAATRTPSPAQLNRQMIGLNSIFINPVIQLLTTKAGN
jgi:hypothetical protein